METNKQTEGGELYGNSEQLKPRLISTLKPNEAIIVTNDAERDAILKLMETECLVWMSGSLPFAYTPNTFPDWIGLSEGRIVHRCDRREHILPASDFLPTDHPLHPEFKGAKDGVSDGVNDGESDGEKPTQPIDYKSLFHQAQSKVDELQAKIEDLDVIYDFDRAQAKKHRDILRSKMIGYAKTWPSSHSAQLLGELILDGLI